MMRQTEVHFVATVARFLVLLDAFAFIFVGKIAKSTSKGPSYYMHSLASVYNEEIGGRAGFYMLD